MIISSNRRQFIVRLWSSIKLRSSHHGINKKDQHRRRGGGGAGAAASGGGRLAVGVAAVAVFGYQSHQIRQWRAERIGHLALARDVWNDYYPRRSVESLIPMIQRCGLMGRTRSVKTDLEHIRAWHIENGYTGGLVLRDLSLPLFYEEYQEPQQPTTTTTATHDDRKTSSFPMTFRDFWTDPMRLARRECYYLYYEITGDGQQKQQIFCRGTTILMDVLTCLEAWMMHDPELECRVHRGFCKQADRILQDVIPLLAPPNDRRGTVELCGHSLGGAVAVILAAKLRKQGYRVVRVTTAGSPRCCATAADARRLLEQLPSDYLRVEQELDFVPFLPPFGAHVGNKLWLFREAPARFVTTPGDSWADSVWYNFLAWEMLQSKGTSHRAYSYTSALQSNLISQ